MRSIATRVLFVISLTSLLMVFVCGRAGTAAGKERDAGCSLLSFAYDTYLGHTIVCEDVPEKQASSSTPAWQAHPSYLKLLFSGYPFPSELDLGPAIYLFPVQDSYRSLYPDEQNDPWLQQVNALRIVLRDRPTWAAPSWQSGQRFTSPPFLPLINAGNIYLAKQKYMTFGSGSGVRYLAQVAQQPVLPSEGDTFYIFEGITDKDPLYSKRSYIAAIFPAFLAVPPGAPPNADFEQQGKLATSALERSESTSFNPDLRMLDDMVASFRVAYPLPNSDGPGAGSPDANEPGMPISGAEGILNSYALVFIVTALVTMFTGIALQVAGRRK